MLTVLVLVMVVLLAMGFPMVVPLAVAGLTLMFGFFSSVQPSLFVQQMVGGVQPVVLTAVPMFILAADIMTKGRTANRLLDLVDAFVRHLRGGLPITTAASCTLFGAVSGSTQATVVAMGSPLRPRLLKAGYRDSFAIALIINASDIALLIPPSIGMIIYGVVAGVSVGELFIAGIGPGLMVLLLFSAYCWLNAGAQRIPREPRADWPSRLRALRAALLPLGFPLIVVGGIYAGLFSPTEAAAISVLYALVLEVLVFRVVRIDDIPGIALSTGLVTSVVFLLVAAGSGFSWVISFAQIPETLLGGFVQQAGSQPLLALAVICAAYFVGCMFVDPIVVILILTPIFAPLIAASGLDPVHVGTLVVLQAAIGSATPPFGCDLFTAIAVFRRPYLDVIRGTPPFIAILLVATILLMFFPQIALFLRDLAYLR